MQKEQEWGDNLTAQAAADRYDLEIVVVQRRPGGTVDEPGATVSRLQSRYGRINQVVWLDYTAESHYNCLAHPANAAADVEACTDGRHDGETAEEARGEASRGDERGEAGRGDGRGDAGRGGRRGDNGQGGRGATEQAGERDGAGCGQGRGGARHGGGGGNQDDDTPQPPPPGEGEAALVRPVAHIGCPH
jgi:hypothetical protein